MIVYLGMKLIGIIFNLSPKKPQQNDGIVSFRLDLVKDKNKTLSDWARESLLEKIEQEYDEKIINEYLLNKDQMKFYSNDEVKKELGI